MARSDTPADQAVETRRERARDAVGFDRRTADRLPTDAGAEAELALGAQALEEAYPDRPENELTAQQARVLSRALSREKTAERASRVASVARKHAAADLPPSTYVWTFMPLFERVVTNALSGTDAPTDDVEAEILAGLRSAMVDMGVGVDEFGGGEVTPLSADEYVEELTMEEVFDSVPYPALLVDDQHTMLQYNVPQRRLLGLDDDHREFLGRDSRDTLAQATYSDGRRRLTLADKVIEAPRNADEEWDIERVDDDNEYTDRIVYRDTSVMKNTAGNEIHIEFFVVPIFNDGGDLKAVFEVVYDRTDTVQYERAVTELVDEVSETLAAIGRGDLSARVTYEDERDVVEDELLAVTDEINGMAANFEGLVGQVVEQTDELAASIERATAELREIDAAVDEQDCALEAAATEMEEFSATMEEVAASSEQVADAAEAALDEAQRGVEAGEDARAVMDEVRASSEELVETVEQLDAYMDEISEVTEVIAEVADQTNMLALNANIEAARAGEAGEGFAVVAEEVKSLAEETQTHTDEIAERIEAVQDQSRATVEEVDESHDSIRAAQTAIRTALEALEGISERVETAADGIQEVAEANDDQASTVESVAATIDEVHDRSREVSAATEDVVAEADTQEAAVDDLVAVVRELRTGSR